MYGIWRVMSFLQNQLPYLGIVGNAQTISIPQGTLLILTEFPCSTFLHLLLNFIYLFVSHLSLLDSVLKRWLDFHCSHVSFRYYLQSKVLELLAQILRHFTNSQPVGINLPAQSICNYIGLSWVIL